MLNKIVRKLLWYSIVLLIISPAIFSIFFPIWILRFISISVSIFVMTGAMFWWVFSGKTFNFKPWNKSGDHQAVFKVLVFAVGVFFLFVLALPLVKDIWLLLTTRTVPTKVGVVRSETWARRGGFYAGVTLEPNNLIERNPSYTAVWFMPRQIEVGKKYEFKYLPNSRDILDAVEVK